MNFVDRYIDPDYSSYEDFHKNCKIRVPEDFNFAYDIVDEYARLEPGKLADVAAWSRDLLSDHTALLDCAFVMKAGEIVPSRSMLYEEEGS